MPRKGKERLPMAPFIILGVVLIAAVVFVIIGLSQRMNENGGVTLLDEPKGETITGIDAPAPQEISVETRKEGVADYGTQTDFINFDYDERTNDFRLLCASPCPVSNDVLDQEFASIAHSIQVMRGVTQSDIDSSLLPIDVHASEDVFCPFYDYAGAYSNTFFDGNKYRGQLCFFYDTVPYDRSNFPYSTSIHEVMHQFQYYKLPRGERQEGGHILWEGLAEMMESIFLRANDKLSYCADKGTWWLDRFEANDNEYTTEAHNAGRALFVDLCLSHGFDYDDLPALFDGMEAGTLTTDADFVNLMSQVVGEDTRATFAKYGVN